MANGTHNTDQNPSPMLRLRGYCDTNTYGRARSINKLLKVPDREVAVVLKHAVGCIVTIDDHKRLHQINKSLDGWKRYTVAKIKVIDLATGKLLKI
jgi:hypothetical protein